LNFNLSRCCFKSTVITHVVIPVASSCNNGSNDDNEGSGGSENDGSGLSGGLMTVAMTIFEPTQILLGKV